MPMSRLTHQCQAVYAVLLPGHPELSGRAGIGEGGDHEHLTGPQQGKEQAVRPTVHRLTKDLRGQARVRLKQLQTSR